MKKLFIILFFLTAMTQTSTAQKTLSFLALGDSYTIGESVPVYQSFPYQTVQLLRKKGLAVHAAEIVAKTGWTTDELMAGIEKTVFEKNYDIVTLLIGVNNQYRGNPDDVYAIEFEALLNKAIAFAAGNKKHVYVLSIPDWGATPFAEGRDRKKIAAEIDVFNSINRKITKAKGITYISITEGTREVPSNPKLVAKDGLHPSSDDYARWAEKLSNAIMAITY
ncbi:MAG: SGNH/GDSL hydrolase family protein [bacterium]|jgi:lysophospholipase L1-like esterase